MQPPLFEIDWPRVARSIVLRDLADYAEQEECPRLAAHLRRAAEIAAEYERRHQGGF